MAVLDTDEAKPSAEREGEETSENMQRVARAYEAFARRDIPAVLSMLDGAIEWNMSEHHIFWPGDLFVGPQAVLDGVFSRIMQTFDGFRVEIERIVGCCDTVLAQVRYRATAKATGKLLNAQAAHIYDFRDGKCVRYQQYSDTWQFAEVAGVDPHR
jgi:ketosteroid isomerase-like protein